MLKHLFSMMQCIIQQTMHQGAINTDNQQSSRCQKVLISEQPHCVIHSEYSSRQNTGSIYTHFYNSKVIPQKLTKEYEQALEIIQGLAEDSIVETYSIKLFPKIKCFMILQEPINETLLNDEVFYLSYLQKLTIVLQISKVIEKAHQNLICHRTIEPINIMVQAKTKREVKIKVNGFWTASKFANKKQTKNGFCENTSDFSAPELFDEQSDYGLNCDVWSIGTIFYWLLFKNIKPILKYRSKEVTTISYPPNIPNWLQYIINSCLQINPKDRISVKQLRQLVKPAIFCAESVTKYLPKIDYDKNSMFKNYEIMNRNKLIKGFISEGIAKVQDKDQPLFDKVYSLTACAQFSEVAKGIRVMSSASSQAEWCMDCIIIVSGC